MDGWRHRRQCWWKDNEAEHFQMNTQGIGGDCNIALHWFCYSFAECERVIKRGFSGVTGYEVAGNPIVVGGN